MDIGIKRRQEANQQFANILGRPATEAELDFVVRLMQDDAVSAYEIGQSLMGLPEYQNALLAKNTKTYADQLAQGDQAILDRAAKTAGANFSQLGRPNSSGLNSQVLSAGRDLAAQRQSMIAAFYGQGLQGNMGLAANVGQNTLARGYGLMDEKRQRGYQLEDFDKQKNLYQGYLDQQKRAQRNQMIGQLGGMAAGAAAGGMTGGQGFNWENAFMGSRMGGGFGGNAGGLF